MKEGIGDMEGMHGRGIMGAEFGMKMMILKMLTPVQRMTVLIRAMDMKMRKKEFKINYLQ
jgi:hypothetical protein